MEVNSDTVVDKLISGGKFKPSLVGISDAALYAYLGDKIRALKGGKTKIITLVGGVASGKTTLVSALLNELKSADFVTTDAFAAGTREYRHTQYGNIAKKYDLDLYKDKIKKLKSLKVGETLRMPSYDEKTGLAAAAGEKNFPKTIKKVDYFIIEGDFNFSKGEEDLSIYLHSPDELRNAKRLKRDVEKRGWGNLLELKKDIKVRDEKQHFPFTLPNAETSDILIKIVPKQTQYLYDIYERT